MLEQKIYTDYVAAMKAKDKPRIDFLSFLRADIQNAAIAAKKDTLGDQETLQVLSKQKKRLEDAKATVPGDKTDFLNELDYQIGIVNEYLPAALNQEELNALVAQVIADTGAVTLKDMGKVMKEALARVGVRGDSKKINDIVRAKLG